MSCDFIFLEVGNTVEVKLWVSIIKLSRDYIDAEDIVTLFASIIARPQDHIVQLALPAGLLILTTVSRITGLSNIITGVAKLIYPGFNRPRAL
jgi:hypothetical protein